MKSAPSHNVEGNEKKFLDLALDPNPHENVMGSVLGQDPSFGEILICQEFLINPADKATNLQTLAKVTRTLFTNLNGEDWK